MHTIVGIGHGLGMSSLTAGSGDVDNNAISNVLANDGFGSTSGGVTIAVAAGTVTIGPDDTFPPPGDEQDICNDRE